MGLGIAVRGTMAALACAALIGPSGANAQSFNDNKPIKYSVDGATATGYMKVVTEAINGIVREMYPGTDATYKPGSPVGGIINISTGKSDFVFTGVPPEIKYAIEGKAPYKQSYKGKFSYVMLFHNDLVMHSFMTEEFADKHKIRTFADLVKAKPAFSLGVNNAGTMQSNLPFYVATFEAYGVKEADLTKWGVKLVRGNISNTIEAFRDGKIDVVINGGFVPTAALADVARSRKIVWLEGDPATIKRAADSWGNKTYTVKAGVYDFVKKDETTITVWNAAVAGAHVPEETVYKFLKALYKNEARVRTIHPTLRQFSMKANSFNPSPLPYHPGAARFYREIGVIK